MFHWFPGLMIGKNMVPWAIFLNLFLIFIPMAIYVPNLPLLLSGLDKRFDTNALTSQSEKLGGEDEGEYR